MGSVFGRHSPGKLFGAQAVGWEQEMRKNSLKNTRINGGGLRTHGSAP